jgi:LmeA-like phospholipid-binding
LRRFLITSVVLVLVVGAGLFAMDRAVAAYAEDQIKQKTVAEVASLGMRSDDPSVDVGGFPFLTEVVSGKYEQIVIVLPNLSGQGMTLPKFTLTASGVNAPLDTLRSGEGTITADKITGTSVVPWDVVVKQTKFKDLKLSADADGTLKVAGNATLGGYSIPLTGSAKVTLAGPTKLRVQVTDLAGTDPGLNSLIKGLIAAYKEKLVFDFSLPKLPYNLKLQKIQATPDGLDITAYAENVPLSDTASR